nr:MAG TPA: hypothetical protein [Caudoviricetes sp.]
MLLWVLPPHAIIQDPMNSKNAAIRGACFVISLLLFIIYVFEVLIVRFAYFHGLIF